MIIGWLIGQNSIHQAANHPGGNEALLEKIVVQACCINEMLASRGEMGQSKRWMKSFPSLVIVEGHKLPHNYCTMIVCSTC